MPPPISTVSAGVIRRGFAGGRPRNRSTAIKRSTTPIVTRNAFFGTFPET